MNTKIKLLFKFLLIISLITFSSCEKDLYEDALKQKNEIVIKRVSLKELSKAENPKLFEKIDKVKIKLRNELGRIVYDSINDFYFDDENGKEIVLENGKKTFTFSIISREGDEKIENILFEENEINEYDAYRVKYNFTEEDLKNLSQQELSQQQITYTALETGRQQILCVDIWTFTPLYHGCTQTHTNGETCIDTGTWTVESICENVADYSGYNEGTGGIASSGWGTGTFGNSGTGSNSGGSQGGGLHTSPVITPGIKFINSLNLLTKENVLSLSMEVQEIIFNNLTTNNFVNQGIVKYFLNNFSNYDYINNQTIETQISIFNFLAQNNFSSLRTQFINQLIAVMVSNPAITSQQFQNWFSSQNIGIESNETQNTIFWNNPNLSFPQQSLPTFDNFYSAYPTSSTTAQQLCTQIGGQILTLHNDIIATGKEMNTCAVRLSYALNYSGITIPNAPNTKLGADGKYYFTFASHLNSWMRETFGTNATTGIGPLNNSHYNFTKQQILDNPLVLNGLQGIFSMTSTNLNWSSGHCDLLFNNSTCLNNCHFEGPINYVDVWILP